MLSGSPPNSFPAAASRLGAGAEREGGGSSSWIRALVGVQLASSTSGDAETSLFPSLPGGDHCPVSHPKTSAGLPALPTTCRRRSGAVRCSEHSAGTWARWQGRLHRELCGRLRLHSHILALVGFSSLLNPSGTARFSAFAFLPLLALV